MQTRQQGLQTGLTLTETLITVAVMAILVSLAAPSFSDIVARWERDRATKILLAHLHLARTEAIKTSTRVVMCNSVDASVCASTAEKDWKSGWIVFRDQNGNNQRDENEAVTASSQAHTGLRSIQANNAIRRFAFLPTGLMSSGMGTLRVKPRAGTTQTLTINRIGRVRLGQEVDKNE